MSEGIDAYIKKKFEVPDVDIRTYSPLTLAYIGDGVFDLVIRSVVVGKGNTRPNQLHHRTSQIQISHQCLQPRCLTVIRHRCIFCHGCRLGIASSAIDVRFFLRKHRFKILYDNCLRMCFYNLTRPVMQLVSLIKEAADGLHLRL